MSSDFRQLLVNLPPERLALLKQRLGEKRVSGVPQPVIRRRTAADPRVPSFAERQLWFLDQLQPGSATYNVPFYCRIGGRLDCDALGKAIEAVVGRHEILRTVFAPLQDRPLPLVLKNWSAKPRQVDLRQSPAAEREAEARRLLYEEAARPFDLSRDLKLRTLLIRLDDEEYVFLHVTHHIAWDLRSKELLYRELQHGYEAYVAGRAPALPEPPVQYADYALWQRQYLRGEVLERLTSYWKSQLAGAPPKLELPIDHARPPMQSLRGAKLMVALPASVFDTVKMLSRRSGVTPFMTLLSAFKTFLYGLTGATDLSVGSPGVGRDHCETDAIIGFFINTMVLRTRLAPELTFRELMKRVKGTTLGALDHALPFEKVVEAVRPPRDLSRMPLFQVNFRLQKGVPPPLCLPGMEVSQSVFIDNGTSKFDLALELPWVPEGRGFWEYSSDLFDEATIVRWAADFEELLTGLLMAPDVPLKDVPIVRALRHRHQGARLG